MNEAEKIRKQLQKYDSPSAAQTEEVESAPQESGSIWDFKLPEDWVPPPRYQSEHEPGSDPLTFKVGAIYSEIRPSGLYGPHHGKRQGIPPPRYPEPGALITSEIGEAYWREWGVWAESTRALHDVIFLTGLRLAKNPYYLDAQTDEWLKRSWTWLLGVWAAKGITPPDQKQINEWATEYYQQTHPEIALGARVK